MKKAKRVRFVTNMREDVLLDAKVLAVKEKMKGVNRLIEKALIEYFNKNN